MFDVSSATMKRTDRREGVVARAAVAAVVILFAVDSVLAQGSAGTKGKAEPRSLVDMPTAGMLDKGTFAVDVDFYQEGGVLTALSAGIFERLTFGVSYGGSRLLGKEDAIMNPLPGMTIKLRLLEESVAFPALAFGFDSQGKDGYLKELDRYTVKSPGLYAVVSKNYLLLGYLSLHTGINYSFERADEDRSFNVYAGAEKTIGPFLSLLAEYNLAMNDNSGRAIGRGRGYMNLALKWSFAGAITLGVNFKDILKNSRTGNLVSRTARIEIVAGF
jgi:hypothetical protein